MAKPDASIDNKILESARAEFLAHSFKGASLRAICANAGVTTGAFYKRYKNKEELFDAVLKPTLDCIGQYGSQVEAKNYEQLDKKDMQRIWDLTPETQATIVNMLYDNYDGFRLLLCHAEGTRYANFIHDLVSDVTKRSMRFIRAAYKQGVASKKIDEEELHMLLTAYWSTLFEPIVHGLSRRRALKHSMIVADLFDWSRVLGF